MWAHLRSEEHNLNANCLMAELQTLLREWKCEARSPDLVGCTERSRGVVHGIRIAIHPVSRHLEGPGHVGSMTDKSS
jgi:hypothetical protein